MRILFALCLFGTTLAQALPANENHRKGLLVREVRERDGFTRHDIR